MSWTRCKAITAVVAVTLMAGTPSASAAHLPEKACVGTIVSTTVALGREVLGINGAGNLAKAASEVLMMKVTPGMVIRELVQPACKAP